MADVNLLVRSGVMVAAHDRAAVKGGAVAVLGDTIVETGAFDELARRYPGARVMGGEKYLLIPGLINGHSHGRGLTDFQRGALDNTLETWLADTRKYLPVSPYDDIAYSAARLLKSGVTATMHNHLLKDPVAYRSEFEEGIRAYGDAGMRVLFCPAIRNDNPFVYGDNSGFLAGLSEEARRTLASPPPPGGLTGDNFVQVVKDLHAQFESPMTRIGFGPLAPQWCTKELLQSVRREADKLAAPIHVHALQTVLQKAYASRFLGKLLIAHMQEIGFLGEGLVIGHCVYPTEADIEVLAATKTGVTHHPSCNLRVRNGIAPAYHMLQAGVRVGLGLDGKSINDDDDLIQEMKVCYLLHRLPSLDLDSPHMSARQVFQMATEHNSALLGYGARLGRIEKGAYADLVLLDYEEMCRPFVDPRQDPIDTLLYRGCGRHVHSVLVNGRLVVSEGRLLTLDERAIGERLAEAASQPPTDGARAVWRALDELREHIKHHYAGWTTQVELDPFYRLNSKR